MTKKEEVQAKLDQNKTDQRLLREEETGLEAELAAMDELRHGDFIIDTNHEGYQLFIKDGGSSGKMRLCQEGYAFRGSASDWSFIPKDREGVISGNINDYFDDLKRNKQNLTEFKHDNTGFSINSAGGLRIASDNGSVWHVENLRLIHQKLGQLLATDTRDRAKKNK